MTPRPSDAQRVGHDAGASPRNAPPHRAPGVPEKWLRPALPLVAGVLLVSMVSQFRVPLLPAMGRELAMSPTELGFIATAFAAGRLALDLPVGGLADRVDPLRLLSAAALAMAVGSAVMAAAPSPGWVYASSVLIGAASATGNTTGMTALSGSVSAARRGSAMALFSGSLLGGQALGPAVSGGIAAAGTWRTAAAGAAVLGVVVAAGAILWGHRSTQPALGRVVRSDEDEETATLTPLERTVLYSVGFSVFFTLGAMPQTLVPLIGAGRFELSTATIGLALGLGGVARMIGAAASGAISDRHSRRGALLPGLVIQAAGVALLVVGAPGWWLVAIVLMSLGSSGNAVAATMLGDRTHGAMLGRTLGRYRFAGDIGLVVGPASAAFAYDRAGTPAAVGLVTAVLIVCAVAAALVLPETHAPRRGNATIDAN